MYVLTSVRTYVSTRGVVPWGAMAPPDFGRSVNPISTRGTDYAHLITNDTSGFSDLPTALIIISVLCSCMQCLPSIYRGLCGQLYWNFVFDLIQCWTNQDLLSSQCLVLHVYFLRNISISVSHFLDNQNIVWESLTLPKTSWNSK